MCLQLCPVTALQTWCEEADITEGAVFRGITKHEEIQDKALSPQSVNSILKKVARDAKLPYDDEYSGHSLRRGFATSASKRGASFASIIGYKSTNIS